MTDLSQPQQGRGALALRRIVADNDPRNGGIAARLVRMIEQPDREPDDDGVYPDAPVSTGTGRPAESGEAAG